MAVSRAVSCAPCTSPCAVSPNRCVTNTPTSAEISVVSSSVPIVSTLILPSDAVLLSLATEFSTDTSTSGMTIICSS